MRELNEEEKKVAVEALRAYDKEHHNTGISSFIRKHNLEPVKIEVGKVYKNRKGSIFKCTDNNTPGKPLGYGISPRGNWYTSDSLLSWCIEGLVEATETEWFEALSKYATEKGYTDGAKIKGIVDGETHEITGKYFNNSELSLLFANLKNSAYVGEEIMKDGIWAELIDPKQEIHDQIEKLRKQIDKLEKLV